VLRCHTQAARLDLAADERLTARRLKAVCLQAGQREEHPGAFRVRERPSRRAAWLSPGNGRRRDRQRRGGSGRLSPAAGLAVARSRATPGERGPTSGGAARPGAASRFRARRHKRPLSSTRRTLVTAPTSRSRLSGRRPKTSRPGAAGLCPLHARPSHISTTRLQGAFRRDRFVSEPSCRPLERHI
jgi:hypothetical protein